MIYKPVDFSHRTGFRPRVSGDPCTSAKMAGLRPIEGRSGRNTITQKIAVGLKPPGPSL